MRTVVRVGLLVVVLMAVAAVWHEPSVQAQDEPDAIVDMDGGGSHTCALWEGGQLQCWGDNSLGQLGDGTVDDRAVPTDIDVGGTVLNVSAGSRHTCAVIAPSGVKCWGSNASGQLGNGTAGEGSFSTSPTYVQGLESGAIAVSAGVSHTCAVTSTGAVCWGSNSLGMLGDGTFEDRLAPTDVVGLNESITDVAAGWLHTCALTAPGAVKCWGANRYGQLGTTYDDLCGPTQPCATTPRDVVGLGGQVDELVVGHSHGCALITGGTVECWGLDTFGQLGDGQTTFEQQDPTPTAVVGLAGSVANIDAAGWYTCATLFDGGVKCWGANHYGQLGNGSFIGGGSLWGIATPIDVLHYNDARLLEVTTVATGGGHACALLAGGGISCWGASGDGQLGNSEFVTGPNSTIPSPVVAIDGNILQLAAAERHTCALTAKGTVKCWGDNQWGQLGDGTYRDRPTPVAVVQLGAPAVAIDAGSLYTCALTSLYAVKCWGAGPFPGSPSCGSGSFDCSNTPVAVPGLESGIAALSTGALHICVLSEAGGVRCVGSNGYGQLGNGIGGSGSSAYYSASPVQVMGLSTGVAGITAGGVHTCAILVTGRAKCWGGNFSGQLGTGCFEGGCTSHNTPADVTMSFNGPALESLVAIVAGSEHTCALTTNATVKCWGANSFRQIGDGTTVGRRENPVDVVGLELNVTALTASFDNTCVVDSEGRVLCWGRNDGQLGDGGSCSTPCPTPLSVGLVPEASAVSNGFAHACAMILGGGAHCWGSNADSQLGTSAMQTCNFDLQCVTRPVPVTLPIDSDGDRCFDATEVGLKPQLGGRRDPNDFWDFYDTPAFTGRDRVVSGLDFFAVIGRFNSEGDPGMDPLSSPTPPPSYHSGYDRSPAPSSKEFWRSGPADGAITGADIFAVLAQFNHSCLP